MRNRIVDKYKHPGYSAAINILRLRQSIVEEKLSKGDKVTIPLLEKLGVPAGEAYEVRIGLRHLDFVDSDDCVTQTFVELAHKTDREYQKAWWDIVHLSYADIFDMGINPAHATLQDLRDAFRDADYQPASMRSKMVSMFRGLCRVAEIITDQTEEPQDSSEQITSTHLPQQVEVPYAYAVEGNVTMSEPLSANLNGHAPAQDYSDIDDIVENLDLLRQLHQSLTWTEQNREWWLKSMTSNANLLLKALEKRKEKRK